MESLKKQIQLAVDAFKSERILEAEDLTRKLIDSNPRVVFLYNLLGLILTGQGSTSDVTLKNDADGTVFTVPTGTDDILFPDSAKAMWGASSDLTLYHDGSNSYITNAVGALKIATETSGIALTIGHSTSEVTVADNLTVAGNLTVSGTQTTVDTVTMQAQNAIIFEGATADAYETTLTIVDPTSSDKTVYMPNATGYLPLLNAASTTVITATPAELNYVDGVTSAIQTQIDTKATKAFSIAQAVALG